jgi:hypothetical protein
VIRVTFQPQFQAYTGTCGNYETHGIATICGVVAQFVFPSADCGSKDHACWGWQLLNRTLLGFVIGVSALRLHWAWHAAIMGCLVGPLLSY